jgi:hypothetical protein
MQDVTANGVLARAAGTNGDVSAVTLAASQLLGRGSTGDVAAIALGSGLSMTGSTLAASGGGGSGGLQDIWIPAAAMVPRITNGAAEGSGETTTNRIMRRTLDFDASTQEFAQFCWRMPKSWDEGTVTFLAVWSHAATTTNFGVVWSLAGVAISDDDTQEVAEGTAQLSTDTGGTTDDLYQSPASSAITIGGSPAEGDYVVFEVARVPADAGDTMAIDARLHGIILRMTTNAATDA